MMNNALSGREIKNFFALFFLIFISTLAGVTILNYSSKIKTEKNPFFVSSLRKNVLGGSECVPVDKPDSILIPKIEIEAPLVFLEKSDNQDFKKSLDQGVIHYPDSNLPGENGQIIFLGHSAPVGWPKIKYDWVFSDLNDLVDKDEIFISYNQCQYTYQVSGKYFLDKGEKLPEDLNEKNKSVLILISCWPPGKNFRRIAIVSELCVIPGITQ